MPPWLITLLSGAAGAFIAAWAGAYIGFRRSRRERALDRRVNWHEEAIQSLAQYEDRLERLRAHAMNVLVIQRTRDGTPGTSSAADAPPTTIRAPVALWTDLAETERRARAALRLADLYTEGKTQLECSVALGNSVNMVTGQWIDISAEPMIPWANLQSKAFAAAGVRRSLQGSLTVALELDGTLAAVLGPRFRRWRTIRRLEKLQAEISAPAS